MRTENDDQPHEWAALYAVDALEGRDRDRFEEHLAGCAQCRDEVATFQEAASHLGADDVSAPPAMRESVLARIDTVDQLSPDADTPAEARTDTAAERPGGEPAGTAEQASATPPARPVRGTRRHGHGHRRGRLTAAFAGLALAAGLVVFVVVDSPWVGEEPAPPVAEQVLTAEDAQRFEEAPDGAEISVVVSPSMEAAVVEAHGLPPAPTGHSYQAWWLVGTGDPVSAGLLDPGESGQTVVLLEGDPTAATAVALTVEPEGGSEAPTTDPVHVVEMD